MKRFILAALLLPPCALFSGTAPDAPTLVTATGISFQSAVRVEWNAGSPSTITAYPIGAYRLTVAGLAPGYDRRFPVGTTAVTVTGVPCGTSMVAAVYSIDVADASSAPSMNAVASVPCPPAFTGAVNAQGALLATVVSPIGVQGIGSIYFGLTNVASVANPLPVTNSSDLSGLTQLTLTANQSHWIRSCAVDVLGVSACAASDFAVLPPPLLNPPVALLDSVTLSWSSVSSSATAPSVTGYAVYYDTVTPTAASSVSVVADVAGTVSVTLMSPQLAPDTPYYFSVATRGGQPGQGSEGSLSQPVFARTNHPTPKISGFGQIQGGVLSLNWAALTAADLGGDTLSGYHLWKSPNSDLSAASLVATTSSALASPFSVTLAAAPTTEYYFMVVSSTAGSSAFPPGLAIGTQVDSLSSPVATAVTANSRVLLSWGAVALATEYRIYRNTNPALVAASPIALAGGTSFLDVSPVSGAGNIYLVTARRAYALGGVASSGIVESASGAYITATPMVMPGMPGRFFDKSIGTDAFYLTATAIPHPVTGLADVNLSWAKSLSGSAVVTGYKVYRGAGLNSLAQVTFVASASLTGYSHVDLNIDASVTYTYAVTAIDVSGNVSAALSRSVAPYVYPSAPSQLSATVGASNAVSLSWFPAAGGTAAVTRYAIFRASMPATTGLFQVTVPASVLAYSDVNAPVTVTALYYSVFSVDKNNISSQLAAAKGVVNAGSNSTNPSTVTAVVVSSISGIGSSVSVAWNPNPSAEPVSYTVYDNATPLAVGLTGTSFAYASNLTYGAILDISVAAFNYSSGFTGTAGVATSAHMPPTPANLSVVAQADTSGNLTPGIQLSWSDMGADGSYLTGYNVYRDVVSPVATGPSTHLASVSANSYRDTAVSASTAYYYAVDAIGNSVVGTPAFSPGILALPLPSAPATFSATALTTGSSVLLSWSPMANAAKIWIFRSGNPGADYPNPAFAVMKTLSAGSLSFTDTGLQSGTSYYYAIAGANYMGLGSQLATGPIIPFPGPATSLAVSYPGNASVDLVWTSPAAPADADQFYVERSTSASFNPSTTSGPVTSPFSDSGLSSGTRYYYRVGASKAGQGNVSSTALSAYPVDAPVAPSDVALIGLPGGKAGLSWAPAASNYGVTSYSIDYSITDTASAGTSNSFTVSAQATSCLLSLSYTPLATSLPLSFSATVSALNALGSAMSAPVQAVSNAALGLPSPSNFTALTGFVETQPNFARVKLNWSNVAGGYSYVIYGATYPFAVTSTSGGPSSPLYLTTVGAVSTFPVAPADKTLPYYFAIATYNPTAGYGGGESYPVHCQPQGVVPYSYPTYVSVTAAQAGSMRFDMAWNAPLFNGSSGALGALPYRLYRFAQASAGSPAPFGPSPDAGFPLSFDATTTSYSDLGVVNGLAYTYYMGVVDSNGREQYPPLLAAYDIRPQGPRQPPQQMEFIAGDATVAIRWLIPVSEGNLNIKYNVYRRLSSTAYAGPLAQLTSVGPAKTQFVNVTQLVQSLSDDTAQNLVTYAYSMSAINSYGEGQKSDERFVTPFKPVRALNPALKAEVTGKKNVLLQWSPAQSQNGFGGYDVTSYLVLRSSNGGGTFANISGVADTGASGYSYLDASTAFGGNYVYTVCPVDSNGNSGVSYQLATVNIPGPVNNILVFKNSFNPDRGETVPIQYSLVVSGHAWVRVYTVQGEYVATLFEEDIDNSVNADNPYLSEKKSWDGKNANGQTVASGVYIIHVDAPGFSSNARVAVIK